jgi:amino acid permease
LIKGFVCTGVLYLPNSFLNGGWGFSTLTLVVMGAFTYYCSILVLEVRQKIGAKSYTHCGKLLFGKSGVFCVNFTLALSQISFTIGYIYVMLNNFGELLTSEQGFGWK